MNYLYKFNHKDKEYGLLKPTRKVKKEGELYYARMVNEYARSGIDIRAVWQKRLIDGGGTLSDEERRVYGEAILNYREKSLEYQRLELVIDKTEEEQKKIAELTITLNDIRAEIQSFEQNQIEIFDNTAEAKARNDTILWWLTKIAVEVADEPKSILEGNSMDEKLDYYDELDNEDKIKLIQKFVYLITLWYIGLCSKEEEFKTYEEENKK